MLRLLEVRLLTLPGLFMEFDICLDSSIIEFKSLFLTALTFLY